jgi:GT2 family glycosyltransferase
MMQKYLPSVIEHSKGKDNTDVEVIVADSGSTDDSIEMLHREFPAVRIVTLDRNYGFAEGYNKAFEKLDKENKEQQKPLPDYYLLLNSDVTVKAEWLMPMLDYMQEHSEVAACQPKLLSDVNPKMFEYAGACGGFIDKYGYPYCRGRIFNTVEEDCGQYDEPKEIMWATGACLLIRRQDYCNCGGLDSRFFAHNEEIDLCWRLNLMGRKVVCVPQSVAYHYGGGTLPQGNPRKAYLNFRNNLTMLYKNLPDEELQSVMRWRTLLDYIAALQMLILGRSYGEFKAVLKARSDFKAWKKDFLADRTRIQSNAIVNSPAGRTPISILWQYYVKGKKIFSQL